MTKREVVKQVRDIIVGNSIDNICKVYKSGKSWKIDTFFGLDPEWKKMYQDEAFVLSFSHCCNEMTLKETEQLFDKKLDIALHGITLPKELEALLHY
jgi:hypothetical protein